MSTDLNKVLVDYSTAHVSMDELESSNIGRDERFPSGWWILLIPIISLLLTIGVASIAFAQSDSDSSAAAGSASQSASGSVASIVNNGASGLRHSGGYDVRNVPSVGAPGIITAFNCAQAVSAGGSWMGGGLALGGTYTDDNCERLAQAGALQAVAGNRAAVIHLARGSEEMCLSLRSAGVLKTSQPCTDAEKRPRKATETSSTKSVKTPYRKCLRREDGAVVFKKRSGYNSADAKSACLTALGY